MRDAKILSFFCSVSSMGIAQFASGLSHKETRDWGTDHGSAMLKGYNSDVMVRGSTYHVQSEDWGKSNPFLVSRVFHNGAVVKSVKTPYESIALDVRRLDPSRVEWALRKQHEEILDLVVSGQF